MLNEKLRTTLLWSAMCVAVAMFVDYVVTILLLHNYPGYTPAITFCIATVVSLPTSYALVSSKIDLRKARDELAVARDAAVGASQSKTNFFANMSHELRTPLNAIIGFAQLLEMDVFAPKRIEYARLVRDSATHLLDLVNDLLDISKIEAGKIDIVDTSMSLEGVLAECCKLVEPRLHSSRLRLAQRIQSGLPPVLGDARAIKQIVLNLLTNAIKFTEPGGTVEVFASLTRKGELLFGVRDEGVGISAADQAKVFERYGRAQHHVVEHAEGTGLGLPIVKGLVEAHGGRIALQSELGWGTCVTIWLPAERVGQQSGQAIAS
ncbi:MAG TPA: HAMP domain-containing sensor histidine kinase [Rhizomicrobium sp.]